MLAECRYFSHCSEGDAVRRLFLVPQDSPRMAPDAETCSSLTFVMNCILLSVIKLVDMFVVTLDGASNTAAELSNQQCHSSVTLVYCFLVQLA